MNHVYRLVWHRSLNTLVAVAEIASARGKSATPRRRRRLRALLQSPLAWAVLLAPGVGWALPSGGQVVAGQASLNQSGTTLTVDQGSTRAIINWRSFGIAADERVTFNQPGATSVALNRVLGSNASAVYGHLNANGQVFLVNPNGVYFAPGAQVNVGGIVASTLGIRDSDFLNGNYHFSGNSTASVKHDGSITATQGGYVAFIGHTVANNGTITTPGGTTALGAGNSVDLTLAGNSLLSFKVSGAALNALAENGGVIHADGGTVLLTAQAKDALLQTVINNTGVIQAQTVANHNGTIELLGGDSGTTQVAGTLDASNPNGGPGGTIETSGAHVQIGSATIDAGQGGQWLIDPVDLTIDSTAAGTINTSLGAGTSVTEQTTGTNASGSGTQTSGGLGDINVDAPISWSTAATLTLSAYHSLNINAAITDSGTGTLSLVTNNNVGGTSSGGAFNVNAPINLTSSSAFSLNGTAYTIITSLGTAADASTAPATMTLQGLATTLSGHYVLGADINASATSTWNGGAGFSPIGKFGSSGSAAYFQGTVDGLGHTISGLTINRGATKAVGLFGVVWNGAVRNIGLVGGSITGGSNYVGGLVGYLDYSTISNAYATDAVSGTSYSVGGLVGYNSGGTITNTYATGAVSGSTYVGGLVGWNSNGKINNAYATGAVTGGSKVGGLVGYNNSNGKITDAYATGAVSGTSALGGLVGYKASGTISNGYWDTTTTGRTTSSGSASSNGLTTAQLAAALPSGFSSSVWGNSGNQMTPYLLANTGFNVSGHVILGTDTIAAPTYYDVILNTRQLQNINSNGTTLAGNYVLGTNLDASSTSGWNGGLGFAPIGSNSTNAFTGTFDGLSHTISGLSISRSSASYVGLFGYTSGSTIRNVGLVGGSIIGKYDVGSLAGYNYNGKISNAYATGSVSGTNNVGGLVGGSGGTSTISRVYATGSVSVSTATSNNVGGLVGYNYQGTVSNAYATGAVSGNGIRSGGLVGINNSGTISDAYATGSVAGGGYIGGLVGYNLNGTITNGYWDTTTGPTTGIGTSSGGTATGGGALGTASLAAALPTGFATNIWANAGNQATPYLLANASFSTVSGHVILGTDTSAAPTYYDVIQNMTELQNINSTGLSGHYVLGTNLDASSTSGWNSGAGFAPISNATTKFTGTFDGLNHTITGLTINRTGTNDVGLFSYVGTGGVVRNIGLTGASIKGKNDVGGLVGSNYSGTISNVSFSGSVTGGTWVGGLVGFGTTGTIDNAYVTGSVTATGNVGGLVGSYGGTISNAYASNSVTGGGYYVGGLVGLNFAGTINNAYATGKVTGSGNNSDVGGLVGNNYSGTISNAYATGSVTSSGSNVHVGGLAGLNSNGTINNGYWDTSTGLATGIGSNNGGTITGGGGLTTAQLAAALPSGFTSSVWDNGSNQTTPYLLANTSFDAYSGSVLLGTDTSGAQYKVITSLTQLQNINSTGLGLDYVLGNAIDASATSGWNGGAGFLPLGSTATNFTAIFDGLGFTIDSLTINRASSSNVGLFGVLGSHSVVRNLGLTHANVTGQGLVGVLAGTSRGTISNAYATGNATAAGLSGSNSNVGGLVGENYGSISNAYATGDVSGGVDVGGLVGDINIGGSVSNAYATGNVSGFSYTGGLVGASDGSIDNVYATGSVSGTNHFGSLVGNNVGTINNGYWDTSVTGALSGIGSNLGSTTGGGGLTTAQLAAALPSGFSSSVWDNIGNQTTPYLLANASFDAYSGSVLLGTDTSGAQYKVITSLTQLQNINSTGLGLDYVLGNNIDASATSTWNSGAGFVPIGDSTTHFTGIFDGLGHSISSLTVNRPSTYYVGLFGYASGTLRDVALLNPNISGLGLAGALVGRSDGTAEYVYADGGSVTVAQHGAGGLVGQSSGTIRDSYATDSVAGLNSGVASTAIGGLVGSMLSGSSTSNSYATGSVSGAGDVGGLVGQNSGTVSTSYWDTTTSGTTTGIGAAYSGATTSGATGLTSAQMLQQANFTGFDFGSPVWVIYNGHTMPLLNVFLTPLTVTATNQSQTYSGSTFTLLNPSYSVAGADTSGHLFGLSDPYNGAVNVGSYSPDLWSDQQGYRITYVGGGLTITPKALTLSGLTAANKVYDGTAAAGISAWGSLSGVVGSDAVSLVNNGASAAFADANVGTGKTVTVAGLTLGGTSAGNYTIGAQITLADITPRSLTASLVGSISKAYDGTTVAMLSPANFQLNGFINGEGAGVTQTVGSYASANAGTGIGVSTTLGSGDFSANSGTVLSNYVLPTVATGTGTITPTPTPASPTSVSATAGANAAAQTAMQNGYPAPAAGSSELLDPAARQRRTTAPNRSPVVQVSVQRGGVNAPAATCNGTIRIGAFSVPAGSSCDSTGSQGGNNGS